MKEMKLRKRVKGLSLLALMTAVSIFTTSCTKEEVMKTSQQLSIEATDAPIDNVEVDAVFVTVSEIWVDGNKVESFNKTTLEVSALTEGRTQLLDRVDVETSSVSNITLVLDNNTDASGATPGSYILKADGTKDQIGEGMSQIALKQQIEGMASASKTVVLDFDLRKMVKESNNDYDLVTDAEIQTSIRSVIKAESNTVKGSVNEMNEEGSKSIAYLYKKGEYNLETEAQGSGESSIEFANAVSSANVDNQGEFMLSYINDGEYELHILEYKDQDNDGKFELYGEAQLTSDLNVKGMGITVGSDVDLTLDVKAIIAL